MSNSKDKSSRNRSSNSQQTTLQMSHSPTSKTQMYYDGANVNGGAGNGAGAGVSASASRSNGHSSSNNAQEYRTSGRTQRNSRESNGHAAAATNGNHYDRYERSNDHHNAPAYNRSSYADRAYSLPRQQQQQANMQPSGYYTQDRRDRSAQRYGGNEDRRQHRDRSREDPRLVSNGGADTPDFYFMPSQRKYSGEVVRVYVDYNKDPKH